MGGNSLGWLNLGAVRMVSLRSGRWPENVYLLLDGGGTNRVSWLLGRFRFAEGGLGELVVVALHFHEVGRPTIGWPEFEVVLYP